MKMGRIGSRTSARLKKSRIRPSCAFFFCASARALAISRVRVGVGRGDASATGTVSGRFFDVLGRDVGAQPAFAG